MKSIIKYLLYYTDLVDYEEKKSKINTKINTKITYTIPPYQYNKIYAYPQRYI
jgi:hypothetical protein